VVAIIAAFFGAGYWSLVIIYITMAATATVGNWIAFPWLPGLPKKGIGVKQMLGFGSNITGFNIVNYFARNADNILVGKFVGAAALGFYSKAYGLLMLPITQIRGPLSSVAIPSLSHIQNDPIRFKRYYIRLITLISFITMPLMVFLFICAEQVIDLVLGSKWSGAIDIFKVLSIAAFIQPVVSTAGLVLVSLGQSKRYLTIGAINSTITVISFVVGVPWGAIGVAVAYTIATYVLIVPTLWYCFRRSPVSIRNFFSAISRPVSASIIMGFVILIVHLYLTNVADIVSVGCSFIFGVLVYLVVLVLVPGGLLLLQEFFSYVLLLFQKKPLSRGRTNFYANQ
jgi:PST family polysaccharide transporter